MLRAVLIGAAVIAAGVVLGAAVVRAQQTANSETTETTAKEQQRSGERFAVKVTPEMKRHSRIRNILYFVGAAYGFGVLLLFLFGGLSRRIRQLAERATTRPFVLAMLYFALFSVASAVLSFPLDLYGGFIVPHQFQLSNQTFGEWLVEGLKAMAVGIVIGAPIVALALAGIRRTRRWWLVLWAGAIPVSIFLVVIYPVFVDPVFNKFQHLRNAELRQKLLALASRAGIEGADVFEVDKSKQTKTMNAYVTGLGPTKRIVLWDTLLAKMDQDEILAVMGHEMGHYVLHHVWKGLGFGFAVMLGVLFLAQRVVTEGTRRWGPRWGFSEPGDPAAVPWLLLVVSIITFLLSPVFAGFSRRSEHHADIFTLELTRLNEATATAFIKLAEDSKIEPQPPAFIEFWRYSHPPLAKRIDFALSYRPWETGQPNQRWREKS
jgi:STE24 endopeptidase